MSDRPHIGLDNAAFQGRLRQPVNRASTTPMSRAPGWTPPPRQFQTTPPQPIQSPSQPQAQQQPTPLQDIQPVVQPANPAIQPTPVAEAPQQPRFRSQPQSQPQPETQPEPIVPNAEPVPSKSSPLKAQKMGLPSRLSRYSRLQLSLVGMAGFIFILGLAVSLQTLRTNHVAAQQVETISKHANDSYDEDAPPSTTKPSEKAFNSYVVAADLPRYLKIPKLGVYARVMQVGVKSNGELGTPRNVHDAAWYTGSSKPGYPGATLIDGHVSSWTTNGVFYGIKNLTPGDTMQIIRGDGMVVHYRVVKTQTYDADSVDMQAAITPITVDKSGLNLITCGGKVKPGTNEFTKRIIVFAEQS